MKLHYAAASPFVRKVRMAAAVRGLAERITLVNADTNDPGDKIRQINPLGKIPSLVLDNGTAIYDSRVICEYLDGIGTTGVPLFPAGPDRWPALTLQALGDGIADAAVLCVYEKRFRPEDKWHPPWVDAQKDRIARTVDQLAANPPALNGMPTIGDIAVAAALAYLDFRLEGEWRQGRGALVRWLDDFADSVPAFAETAPN